jgi:hypothetical protein|tara:strand:- start:1571 stop:1921 length:351 start_codon:yes stop_codon:yes gene_type:complete
MDNFLEKLINNIIILKTSCKAQIIQASNSPEPLPSMRSLRSCYETSETCDLVLLFVANRSPNIKSCLTFFNHVVKRCYKECFALKDDKYCKKTALNCAKESKKVMKLIKEFKEKLA